MEEKDFKEFIQFMDKINEAMKTSRSKSEEINTKRKELYEETRPLVVEDGKKEIEKMEEAKAEHEEMTGNALKNAYKKVQEIKQENELLYQQKLMDTLKEQTRIKRQYDSMNKQELTPEKKEWLEKSSKNSLEKVNKEMQEFQKDHFEVIDSLNNYKEDIKQYAIELKVDLIDKPEKEVTEQAKGEEKESVVSNQAQSKGKEAVVPEQLQDEVPETEVPVQAQDAEKESVVPEQVQADIPEPGEEKSGVSNQTTALQSPKNELEILPNNGQITIEKSVDGVKINDVFISNEEISKKAEELIADVRSGKRLVNNYQAELAKLTDYENYPMADINIASMIYKDQGNSNIDVARIREANYKIQEGNLDIHNINYIYDLAHTKGLSRLLHGTDKYIAKDLIEDAKNAKDWDFAEIKHTGIKKLQFKIKEMFEKMKQRKLSTGEEENEKTENKSSSARQKIKDKATRLKGALQDRNESSQQVEHDNESQNQAVNESREDNDDLEQ